MLIVVYGLQEQASVAGTKPLSFRALDKINLGPSPGGVHPLLRLAHMNINIIIDININSSIYINININITLALTFISTYYH